MHLGTYVEESSKNNPDSFSHFFCVFMTYTHNSHPLRRVNEEKDKMSKIKQLAEDLYGDDWVLVLEDKEHGR